MLIIEDTRQQVHDGDKHAAKHAWWEAHGVMVVRRALPFGDYVAETEDGTRPGNVAVDTKKDLAELSGDVFQGHRRFRDELVRAADAGWRLYILVETRQCADMDGLRRVRNVHPRARGVKPLPGGGVAKTCEGLARKYRAVFEFCDPRDSARRICELLGVEYGKD